MELFLRNLLLVEKNELRNRSMHICGMFDKKVDIENAKVDIGSTKVDIEDVKVDIRQKLLSFSRKVSAKTVNHAGKKD